MHYKTFQYYQTICLSLLFFNVVPSIYPWSRKKIMSATTPRQWFNSIWIWNHRRCYLYSLYIAIKHIQPIIIKKRSKVIETTNTKTTTKRRDEWSSIEKRLVDISLSQTRTNKRNKRFFGRQISFLNTNANKHI